MRLGAGPESFDDALLGARMLGRTAPPLFLHHPLLLDAEGRKLSKSAGDTGVRELRASGLAPAEVVGMAAAAVGLAGSEPVAAARVDALFAPWGRRPRSSPAEAPDPGPLR